MERAGSALGRNTVILGLLLSTFAVLTASVTSCVASRPPLPSIVEAFALVAPSGNTVYGLIRRPDVGINPGHTFPAVILVPGGVGAGRQDVYRREARALSEAGMVVVCFNAEGRVSEQGASDLRSEGEEDYNGFRHQDGLARIVEMVAALAYVDPGNVGLWSQSYGITMAAGCAGRYPDLPIAYLVDGEGPSDSFVTCFGPRYLAGDHPPGRAAGVQFGRRGTWEDPSPENSQWWAEREAVRYIGRFRGRYLRLQATWDHAQPPDSVEEIDMYYHPNGWPGGGPAWWHNKHATDMINAAIEGGVPWARVNLPEQGNAVNAAYDAEHQPVFLPGALGGGPWTVRAVLEMAGIAE